MIPISIRGMTITLLAIAWLVTLIGSHVTVTWCVVVQLYSKLKATRDVGAKLKSLVRQRGGLEVHAGMSDSSAEGTTHSVRKEEQVAFANWINRCSFLPPSFDLDL